MVGSTIIIVFVALVVALVVLLQHNVLDNPLLLSLSTINGLFNLPSMFCCDVRLFCNQRYLIVQEVLLEQ